MRETDNESELLKKVRERKMQEMERGKESGRERAKERVRKK